MLVMMKLRDDGGNNMKTYKFSFKNADLDKGTVEKIAF